MTAAAAAKKKASEFSAAAEQSEQRMNGLWIDESRLPTTLAKQGSPKEARANPLSPNSPFLKPQNRLLQLAEMALRNSVELKERRKKNVNFKGKDRRFRSTR